MLETVLILLVLGFGTTHTERYSCQNDYQPFDYVGIKSRVPIDCFPLQLDCPTSWKSGIPRGSETSAPKIYQTFLTCHESFTTCGYVPINIATGEVLGQSGVTIGGGVDLGNKSKTSFPTVSSKIVDKLEPYFGLKGNLAACAAIEHPLRLTAAEADTLTDVITDDVVGKVSKQYDSDKERNALAFASLPRGIRTAIVSVWFQFGYPQAYPRLWNFVTKNDWNNAIKELRNFYINPQQQTRGDLRRRNDEANIIEATLAKCNRSIDVVFLLDDSGSVGKAHFQKSLDFVKNMIKAFPVNKRGGNNGARFGLSTFDTNYRSKFFLSNYTNHSAYLSAINRIHYSVGGSKLGRALELILQDQFSEERGLRPAVDGILRILIVLTDGKSEDSVSIPAKGVKDENIVIYAIGIDRYYLPNLREIASSNSKVYTMSIFTDLKKFISTLMLSVCYEPRPVSLNETICTNVTKNTYLYFSYEVNKTSNIVVNVIDISGRTVVYVSRTNAHPYKYDNDISMDISNERNKFIVISASETSPDIRVKRSTDDKLTRPIYVSVTSDTDSASFKMEGNEHIPWSFSPGATDMPVIEPPTPPLPIPPLPTPPLPTPPPPTATNPPLFTAPPLKSTSSDGTSTAIKVVIASVAAFVVVALVTFLIVRRIYKK